MRTNLQQTDRTDDEPLIVLFGSLILFSIISVSPSPLICRLFIELTVPGVQTAISAWLTSRYNTRHDYLSISVRDKVYFLVFASVWTLVFSIVYLGLFFAMPNGIMSSVISRTLGRGC